MSCNFISFHSISFHSYVCKYVNVYIYIYIYSIVYMFDKRIWVKLLLTRKKTHGLLNTSVSQLVQDISNKKTNLLAASNHMLHQTDTCCTKRTSNHHIAPTPSAPFASKILGSSTPYSSTISCLFHPRHFV